MADEQYTQLIHAAEEKLLRFLQTFEFIQENIHFGKIGDSQARLQNVVGDMFATLSSQLAQLSPPAALSEFHTTFTAAIAHCSNASEAFLQPGKDFSVSFLNSRWALCRGMNLLYGIRRSGFECLSIRQCFRQKPILLHSRQVRPDSIQKIHAPA